ncbi:hypothetical protein NSK_007508 [Nannochloropsis salina CCMP1776]|uniref:Uncharacterized protein n=1 Tax=Nannochloropsis salina CCMP1776 TaxID=1027361 RepID=A0A4D9CRI8_9STRA|nr:hypothetical protein NSK_007508 [Nannochloropsis salina CCMP1776]|eukprot:TFJ81164.1 hypothetical protein NSK_007508 [Nannochloropsis salina CCMP1776]
MAFNFYLKLRKKGQAGEVWEMELQEGREPQGRSSRADPRRNRPDTDKLFDVVTLLQQIPGHRPVSADEILKELGVDLRPPEVVDRAVHSLLEGHPKGLPEADVIDAYPEDDGNRPVYFHRGEPFLVSLSGSGRRLRSREGEDGGGRVGISHDLRSELRRGEAVRVGGEWFRVDILENRKVQRLRAETPVSVTIGAGRRKWPPVDFMDEKSGYKEAFSLTEGLPLDHSPLPGRDEEEDLPLVRHGCTSDVRDLLWSTTRQHVPSDEKELRARLQEAALGTHQSGPRRPKMSAAVLKSQANKKRKLDKEAAWRDDIRAKAAAIQAMQQQAKKRKK